MVLETKFLTHCVPVRSLLAAGVYATNDDYMKYWTAPAAIAAVAGIYRYSTYDADQRGANDQKVWWNTGRITHILITIIFIILIVNGKYGCARMLPILDLIIGIGIASDHYFTQPK